MNYTPYWYALGANLSFSLASLVFTHFAHKVSPSWMNAFKATVAFIAFGTAVVITGAALDPTTKSLMLFLLSGLIGLNIGDMFLLKAFTELGVSRTLMLFGFQPFILGVASYFLFDQIPTWTRLAAVLLLVGSLFVVSLESYRKNKDWKLKGLTIGFVAIFLDAMGVLMTRVAFDNSPDITPMAGNFLRASGAVIGFILLAPFLKLNFLKLFYSQTLNSRFLLIFSSLSGTFLSLYLYLTALRVGNLASLSAIAITGPVFAGFFECVITKQYPSRYLIAALSLFAAGFFLMVQ